MCRVNANLLASGRKPLTLNAATKAIKHQGNRLYLGKDLARLISPQPNQQVQGQHPIVEGGQDYGDLFNILDMNPAEVVQQDVSLPQEAEQASEELFPEVWLNNILDAPATAPATAPETTSVAAGNFSLANKAPLLANLLDNTAPVLDNAPPQEYDLKSLLAGACQVQVKQELKHSERHDKYESDSDDSEEPNEVIATNATSMSGSRRASTASKQSKASRKLYECEPFEDPVLEKKRLDALHAKENRDRKKAEKSCLLEENKKLKKENRGLKRRERQLETRIDDMEKTVERLMQIILSNGGGGAQQQQQGNLAGNSNPKNQFRVTTYPSKPPTAEKPIFVKIK